MLQALMTFIVSGDVSTKNIDDGSFRSINTQKTIDKHTLACSCVSHDWSYIDTGILSYN